MKSQIKNLITLGLLALLLIINNSVMAQTANFSGNWTRNDDQTKIEGLSINSVPKFLVIRQDSKAINITRTSVNGQGDTSRYTERLMLDGSTSDVMTPSNLKRSAKVQWSFDKTLMTETYDSKDDQGNIKQSGKLTMILQDGGKTLEINATQDYSGRTFQLREIFDKQ